jgi:peptidase M15-like protein
MPDLNEKFTKDYTFGELVYSDLAETDEELKFAQRNPDRAVVESLRYLARTVLQPIREALDQPIRVRSGFRSRRLNELVGGGTRSQHLTGEAVDLMLDPTFLHEPNTAEIRAQIEQGVEERVGRPLRADVYANFYLFAFICLRLSELDVDQVLHEYGDGFGQPAWIHVSASQRLDKRQVLYMGSYTERRYQILPVEEALAKGCEPKQGVVRRLLGP